jgi:hypothetical protein
MTARRSLRLATRATIVAAVAGFGLVACVPAVLASAVTAQAIPSFTNLPTFTLAFPPEFSVSPTTLDFRDTVVGGSDTTSVTLTNNGTDASYVYMTGGTPTSTAYQFLRDENCLGKTFKHGQTCFLGFSFTPESAGRVVASATFKINFIEEPRAASFTVTLTGCGVPLNGTCPPAPTPTATAKPTNRGGPRTGPAAQPTAGGTSPVAAALPPATPVSTAVVESTPAAGGGPSLLAVALVAAGAACVGAAIAGLVFWRGRQIWARLTSGRH